MMVIPISYNVDHFLASFLKSLWLGNLITASEIVTPCVLHVMEEVVKCLYGTLRDEDHSYT